MRKTILSLAFLLVAGIVLYVLTMNVFTSLDSSLDLLMKGAF